MTYNLLPRTNQFELSLARTASASIDQLFNAFRNNPHVPVLADFTSELQKRIATQSQLSLYLGTGSQKQTLDIKPPTSSGKVREAEEDEYE